MGIIARIFGSIVLLAAVAFVGICAFFSSLHIVGWIISAVIATVFIGWLILRTINRGLDAYAVGAFLGAVFGSAVALAVGLAVLSLSFGVALILCGAILTGIVLSPFWLMVTLKADAIDIIHAFD